MEKLNRVQRHLLSFGYPMSIVREYQDKKEYYRKEDRKYVEEKRERFQANRSGRS